jgi:hypothetical protein
LQSRVQLACTAHREDALVKRKERRNTERLCERVDESRFYFFENGMSFL